MSILKTKVLIIIGAVALVIVLYLQSTQIVSKKEEITAAPADFFSRILAQAKSSVKRQELEPITKLEADVEKANTNSKVQLLDSLAHSWQRLQIPAIAAHYYEEEAKLMPSEKYEMEAGAAYYDAFTIAGDSSLKQYLVQGAIRNYEKVIAQDSTNLDAKTGVALCYVEGTSNPMQGIMLLREVVAKNPKQENAQYDLGVLSIRSGQMDKAVDRLTTVLDINPKRYDVYLLRAGAYMRLGKNEEALKDFKKVKNESGDAAMISEADNYISKLSRE